MDMKAISIKHNYRGVIYLCFLLPGLLFSDLVQKFQTLKAGYQSALEQTESQTVEQLSQLDQKCVQALNHAATEFREKGNLGFYLELRT